MQRDKKKYDVIVCGGGPAGVIAAVAAARNDADTLLIERQGCLGGIASSGLLSVWGPFDDGSRLLDWKRHPLLAKGLPLPPEMQDFKRIIKGIPEEILNRLKTMNMAFDLGWGFIPINPEAVKFVSEQMVLEAGGRILYETMIVDAAMRKGHIEALRIAGKSGIREARAEIYVDATGDGDLAALAGADFQKGRARDGKMMGVTLVFRLGGVKLPGMFLLDREEIRKCNALFAEAWKNGEVSALHGVGCINIIPGMKGVVAVNSQHTYDIDGTRDEDLTQAFINGRKDVQEMIRLFRQHLRGFEKCFLVDTAPMMGVRDTRRIIGEYILTGKDVVSAAQFADSIGRNAYNLDIHLPDNAMTVEEGLLKPGASYQIPYRCLVPKKISNLLLSGRCISATHEGESSARIMPCCMVTGQAAGTAAA
ncbi:MAG: FAD-dependent oxidoreductase, partial [Kiritimatiellae bacterium]|nr:FAD-dependent oxidoreductase [Kiritimatiellia bacterium]